MQIVANNVLEKQLAPFTDILSQIKDEKKSEAVKAVDNEGKKSLKSLRNTLPKNKTE